MEISWPGDSGEIHTKLLLAMREILLSDKQYAFLGSNAAARLSNARRVALNAGMNKKCVVFLGGQSYVLFPWLGTRSFRTMRRILKKYSSELGIFDVQSEGCYYITFKAKPEFGRSLLENINLIIERDGLDTETLVFDGECPVFNKFDEFIPPELLRIAYAKDRLMADEIIQRFSETEMYI